MGSGGMGWLWFSAFATLSVTPVFISIPFFARNFHVKPETFTAWYFASVSLGVALWLWLDGRAADLHPGRLRAAIGIVLVGLSFGAAANGLLFRGVRRTQPRAASRRVQRGERDRLPGVRRAGGPPPPVFRPGEYGYGSLPRHPPRWCRRLPHRRRMASRAGCHLAVKG